MADIRHLLTIKAPASKVYEAVTSQKGLQNWWTTKVKGNSKEGEQLQFGFDPDYAKSFDVKKSNRKNVEWKCTNAHPEWIGTTVRFDLEENNGATTVRFAHDGWKNETDMYALCNFHWGKYMQSLQSYCENGSGQPYQSNYQFK